MERLETLETIGNLGNHGEGNTKLPRVIPSRYWCFTYFFKNISEMETLETLFKKEKIEYYFGVESCPTTGKDHLQGFINSKNKIRPLEKFKIKEIHWEKTKGNKEQNLAYCSKEGKIYTNMKLREAVVDPLEGLKLHSWQEEILEIIKKKPDRRKIYWYWESTGNAGKSLFTTHLCLKHDALAVIGKAADVKFAFVELFKKRDIPIVIWDIPRCIENVDYISYTAIEEIKCGRVFSTKFESGMVIFNTPHIFIFANKPPNIEKMSKDRWVIKNINNEEEEELDIKNYMSD